MALPLQIALFLASVAIVALVACLIPLAFQARGQLQQLILAAEQLKAKVEILAEDSRDLVRNFNTLTTRANQQLDNMEQVVRTARQWTERADRLVNEVGAAIEPPVLSLVRNITLLRTGVTSFFQALTHRNHHDQTPNQPTEE
jgi:uncharacterized protein YoxC